MNCKKAQLTLIMLHHPAIPVNAPLRGALPDVYFPKINAYFNLSCMTAGKLTII